MLAAAGAAICAAPTALAQAQSSPAQRPAASEWQDANLAALPAETVEFELTEGTWMSVDVSPDGKTIAFDLLNDIYVMPATGGEARAIHAGSAAQRSPQFSPDGRKLLYLSDESGADNVWISNPDGSQAQQVTHERLTIIAGPAWAPDGSSIVVSKTDASVFNMKTTELWRYSVPGAATPGDAPARASSGAATSRLASGPARGPGGEPGGGSASLLEGGSAGEMIVPAPESGKDLQEPRYAPNGRYLYYTERVGGEHYVYVNTGLSNFVIKRRDLRNGTTVDLISGFGSATSPQVSPDGKSIAFIRRVRAKTVLFRYDVEQRTQTPVYENLDRDLQADYVPQEHYYPAYDWFPDNRHVAIWGKGKLLRIDMRTGQAQQIPFRLTARHQIHQTLRVQQDAAPDEVQAKIIRNLAISPDGAQLLFRALGKLWRQDVAGSRAPQRLTRSDDSEFEPAWSPDGRTIAYVAWDDAQGSTLRLRSAANGRERVLVRSGGVIRQPVYSHDGARIAYRIMEPDSSMGGARDPAGLYIVDVEAAEAGSAARTSRAPRSGGQPEGQGVEQGAERAAGMRGANGAGESHSPGPRFLAPAAGVAQFSANDERIYFFGAPDYYARRAVILRSVGVDGSDIRDHAYAETADTGDFLLSPDFEWIAFKEYNQLFVMPYAQGESPVAIRAAGNPAARRLTIAGGFEQIWSADSSRLYWMLGHDLYATTPAARGPVEQPQRAVVVTAPTDVPEGTVAFVNARVIPMTGEKPAETIIERGAVVVVRNRIAAVGPMGQVDVPAGAKVIDLAGKTLMPGFFDAHGHIDCCFMTGVMPVKQPTRYAALAYGVTTNYDPYSNELTSYESGEMTLTGDIVGPRWLSSGQVIYGRSGKPDRVFDPIANLQDARNIVRRKTAIGGTILKSYKLPTRAQKQLLMQAAIEGGVMVDMEGASHFYDNVSTIIDGHTALEHNLPVANYYDDLLQLFKHSQMANTPTLIVTFGELFAESYIYQHEEPWKESKVRTFIPEVNNAYNPIAGPGGAPLYVRAMQSIHYADELYDVGFRSVGRSIERLDDAGVTINVGSHGQAPGIAIHWEMQLMAESGMSPIRILRAATINGARTWGLDHQLGTLEPGKLADMIVLERDPLVDIRNTNSVRYTMINGRLYDAETMNEIGNYERPRTPFFWETGEQHGIHWNSAWNGG